MTSKADRIALILIETIIIGKGIHGERLLVFYITFSVRLTLSGVKKKKGDIEKETRK